nr:unnamed protein product [Callosobruchus analis]
MKSGSKRKFDNGGIKDAENLETPQVSKTWDSYTPKMLKKHMSQKLRVKSNSKSVKDLYYKKKTILVEEDIKKNRMEQQDILNRREREQEGHKIKWNS